MASYNGDFNRMQEEALARLREMQKRSRTAVNMPGQSAKKETPHEPEKPQRERANVGAGNANANVGNAPQVRQRPDPLRALLGDIKIDPEKALILLMLLVLYKNKADIKLLAALGYLLM